MKFGKSLSHQIEETLPEWRDKFLCYKDLKKRLKKISPNNHNHHDDDVDEESRPTKRPKQTEMNVILTTSKEEQDFINLLEEEIEKFNAFFVEKEEEYIIRQKDLHDRVCGAVSKEDLINIRKEIVDFHGEMVLMENYSALNYTGLVKILKKYDKRTGALMRLPFIQKVLQQPFFTTDILNKLVKECEAMLDRLFPNNEPSVSGEDGIQNGEQKPLKPGASLARTEVPELEEIEYMESLYMKSTVAALRALKEIRSGSSTLSVFSLPPLPSGAPEEKWSNIPALEQEAK